MRFITFARFSPLVRNSTLTLIGSLAFLGCAKVTTAPLNTRNIEVTKLQTFDVSNLRMVQNRFFLWKEDFTVEQKIAASDVADQLDATDTYRTYEFPKLYEGEFAADLTLYNFLKENLPIVERALKKLVLQTSELQKKIDASIDEVEKTKLLGDMVKLKDKFDKKSAEFTSKTKEFNDKFGNLQMEKFIQANLDLDKKVTALSDFLRSQTDFNSNPPKLIYLEFDDTGAPQVKFDAWEIPEYISGEQYRNFSSYVTEQNPIPNIVNIKYSGLAGRWEFDVITDANWTGSSPLMTYHFDIARNAYDDKFGRKILFGDITRTEVKPDGTVIHRTGIAKLVNSTK